MAEVYTLADADTVFPAGMDVGTADLDRDGAVDIVVQHGSGAWIFYGPLVGTTYGTSDADATLSVTVSTTWKGQAVVDGDYNGDDYPDVALSFAGASVGAPENGAVYILYGGGL